MEIVIKIPEKDFESIKKGYLPFGAIADAIRNGTPLPEHHGRLIDADELKNLWHGCKITGSIDPLLDCRPTIIEGSESE